MLVRRRFLADAGGDPRAFTPAAEPSAPAERAPDA